jgi:hypothetical protein
LARVRTEVIDAVELQPAADQLAALARLGLALGGQVDVDPAGEAVFEVPLALAVAKQDEGRQGAVPGR